MADIYTSYHALLQHHSRQKYRLMAHHYEGYRELGRYLAQAHDQPLDNVVQHYRERFEYHMAFPATRKSHTNVLQHIFGYLKREIDSASKRDILASIEAYRLGQTSLDVPLTLLDRYIQRFGSDYIRQQSYLNPGLHESDTRSHT
ncbi:DUF1722 domain-containing protein [Marinobacterium marinum]|uniref:YbgA family protein n=1 Tax=Marinobacterium marinum TaxID=2756129 RepID=A0A7W1WW80_9GAMM|nr:YbgA family protein [Marinobacterium marinum]MBA4501317.1 YbgA family protein [Marinobacterium marinum]